MLRASTFTLVFLSKEQTFCSFQHEKAIMEKSKKNYNTQAKLAALHTEKANGRHKKVVLIPTLTCILLGQIKLNLHNITS